MKIGVYYIVTGPYKDYFKLFLESLVNFFPGELKVVKLISDGLEEYKDYKFNDEITVELCPRINHYPWPIVTLYKHWHILQNFDEICDYMCYFNANSEIHKNNPELWCDFDKLNVSYHSFSNIPTPSFPDAYNIRKDSVSYLEPKTYEYIQGGFFFAKSSLVKTVCTDIVNMVNKDSEKLIYAQWHDESYMNKWVQDNIDKVNKKFIMTVYDRFINEKTFIKLPIKNKNIVKFKGF